ncbi:MAG: DUF6580 family putative transport protein [Nanoarchaeota archaeon]
MQESKILLKKKKRKLSKLSVKQRLAQLTLQKQLQIINLREWLLTIGFILGAAALRAPMQAIPSAEPITFFALLSGWLFGKRKGFFVGAGALYASNFLVFGGQGIWTLFQAIGFGMAGFLGGFLRKNSKIWHVLLISILGTVFFELIINIGSLFMFPFGFFTLFLTALPFGIIHLISNTSFALLLPQTKKFIEDKGEFNQKEVCRKLIDRFNNLKKIWVREK